MSEHFFLRTDLGPVEYTLSEADYVAAGRLFSQLTPRTIMVLAIFVLLLIVMALFPPAPVMREIGIGGLVGGVVGFVVVRYVFGPWNLCRHYRSYQAAREPVTIELKAQGVHFEAALGTGLVDWSRVIRWRENEHFILLYQAPSLYHVIPRRVGPLVDGLVAGLAEHVGPAT